VPISKGCVIIVSEKCLDSSDIMEQFQELDQSLHLKDREYSILQARMNALQRETQKKDVAAQRLIDDISAYREEMRIKDNYISSLDDKIKQSRASNDSMSTLSASQANAILGIELQKLKDCCEAHVSQNTFLMSELKRNDIESKLQQNVKNYKIKNLLKELEEIRQNFQELRRKLLAKQPSDLNLQEELEDMRKELFYSVGLTVKLKNALAGKPCSYDLQSLWQEAVGVPTQEYESWISQNSRK